MAYHSLYPMYSASVNPYQVTRSLYKPVYRDILFIQILQHWPPWAFQVVDVTPENTRNNKINICNL